MVKPATGFFQCLYQNSVIGIITLALLGSTNGVLAEGSSDDKATSMVKKADKLLLEKTIGFNQKRNCIACHRNGTYITTRPEMTRVLGKPNPELREHMVKLLRTKQQEPKTKLMKGMHSTMTAYLAWGFAEWDKHVNKRLTEETKEALQLMFSCQREDGSWNNAKTIAPTESSAYHATTVAVMAAATAPQWLVTNKDEKMAQGFAKAKEYLKKTKPPHDWARFLLLYASTRVPDLLTKQEKDDLIAMVRKRQRPDGGWSIRSFARPEEWAHGHCAKKLTAEKVYNEPLSDGYQTGMVITVFLDSGISADDPQLKKAIEWLLKNQQEKGHWPGRSLMKEKSNMVMSLTGSCYAALALVKSQVQE